MIRRQMKNNLYIQLDKCIFIVYAFYVHFSRYFWAAALAMHTSPIGSKTPRY